MGLLKDLASVRAALRLILGAAAAFGLVVFVAQIPPGTISEAASAKISSTSPQAGTSPQLSRADLAACGLMQGALLHVARGMEFERALTNYAFVPWPQGQPSADIRAVFNSFQRATVLQVNYMHGQGSQQEAADAFNSSVSAYAHICEAAA